MIPEDAILFLYKPAGITSNDCIQKIKRTLGIKKIGHAGTLDKFAQGMLIILIGKATKLSDIFLLKDKSYVADMYMGKETSTLDPEGECVHETSLPSESTLCEVIQKYKGPMKQIPPKYSAIHIQGKRASDLIREGKDFDMPIRDITIYSLDIIHIALPIVRIQCRVSKGTYIRSLVRDIARDADACAYVQYLERSAIENWDITHTINMDTLLSDDTPHYEKGVYALVDILDTFIDAYKIEIDDNDIRVAFQNGTQPLHLLHKQSAHYGESEIIYMIDGQGLLAVWRCIRNDSADIIERYKLLLHY